MSAIAAMTVWAVVLFALSAGIALWCRSIFRGKGRSPRLGFALGFAIAFASPFVGAAVGAAIAGALRTSFLPFLPFVMLIVGPAIAVVISYAMPPSAGTLASAPRIENRAPSYAKENAAVSAPALVATFGPATGWVGKAITYERGRFVVEGIGAVSARDVVSYGEKGYLTWVADGMRVWVARVAATEGAPETAGSL